MAKWEYADKPMHSEHRRADPRCVDKDMATQCLPRWRALGEAVLLDFQHTHLQLHHLFLR